MRFIGDDLTPIELEVRGLRVDPLHRSDEAGLMGTRWFDYADMHPVTATYCFAHHYKHFTNLFCAAYIDLITAEEARAFTPDDVFMSRDLTSMWLARQCPDAHGMPYPFVMEFAQQRALNRHFHRFPRPNQMYGEEFELDLVDAFKAHTARSLTYSQDPRFKQWGMRSLKTPLQVRHAEFVRGQVLARPVASHVGLLSRMFREGVLSPALAADHFPEGTIDSATAGAGMLG